MAINDENSHSHNHHSNTSTNTVDYDQEGIKLLARVHLEPNAAKDDGKRWRKLNAKSTLVYKDPETNGSIHIGNAVAARSLDLLDQMGSCRKIVYCQGGDKFEERLFRNNPEFDYFHFPIASWKRTIGLERCQDPDAVVEYFTPLFDYLDDELANGNAVLIHCLAGAHRAGTTGIASLMYLTGMNAKEATKLAKSLRPIINPIGDFPVLLKLLEEGLKNRREAQTLQEQ